MKSNIDILFVSHVSHLNGGAEKSLANLVRYLKENQKLKVHVIVPIVGDQSEWLYENNIPYSVIPQPYWAKTQTKDLQFQFTNPDFFNNITSVTVELIKKLNPKLCVTNTVTIPWLAYAAAICNIKHAWLIHETTISLDLAYEIGEKQAMQTISILSDMVFLNSKSTLDYYTNAKLLSPTANIGMFYPPVELQKPASIQSPFRVTAKKLIVVGQLKPQKGQFDAVKAVKQLKDEGMDIQLAIVGLEENKNYVSDIRKYVSKNNLIEDILWLGYQKNPFTYTNLADIVLVCSKGEAFGLVTVEGMLSNKPIVGADSAGTSEIIEANSTGLLYEPGNSADLSIKLKKIIEDPNLATRLATNGKRMAEIRFSPEKCYEDFLIFYSNNKDNERLALNLSPLQSVLQDNKLVRDGLLSEIENLKEKIDQQNNFIRDIKNSKTWKLIRAFGKVFRN